MAYLRRENGDIVLDFDKEDLFHVLSYPVVFWYSQELDRFVADQLEDFNHGGLQGINYQKPFFEI